MDRFNLGFIFKVEFTLNDKGVEALSKWGTDCDTVLRIHSPAVGAAYDIAAAKFAEAVGIPDDNFVTEVLANVVKTMIVKEYPARAAWLVADLLAFGDSDEYLPLEALKAEVQHEMKARRNMLGSADGSPDYDGRLPEWLELERLLNVGPGGSVSDCPSAVRAKYNELRKRFLKGDSVRVVDPSEPDVSYEYTVLELTWQPARYRDSSPGLISLRLLDNDGDSVWYRYSMKGNIWCDSSGDDTLITPQRREV